MIASHYDYGKTRFNEFMKGLDTEACSFYQPIKKNKTDFFKQTPDPNAGDSKEKNLKGRLSPVLYDFHILPV